MRGSGSSRRYCFRRQATSWTLASEGMEGLPESRVACVYKALKIMVQISRWWGDDILLKLFALPQSQPF